MLIINFIICAPCEHSTTRGACAERRLPPPQTKLSFPPTRARIARQAEFTPHLSPARSLRGLCLLAAAPSERTNIARLPCTPAPVMSFSRTLASRQNHQRRARKETQQRFILKSLIYRNNHFASSPREKRTTRRWQTRGKQILQLTKVVKKQKWRQIKKPNPREKKVRCIRRRASHY